MKAFQIATYTMRKCYTVAQSLRYDLYYSASCYRARLRRERYVTCRSMSSVRLSVRL